MIKFADDAWDTYANVLTNMIGFVMRATLKPEYSEFGGVEPFDLQVIGLDIASNPVEGIAEENALRYIVIDDEHEPLVSDEAPSTDAVRVAPLSAFAELLVY